MSAIELGPDAPAGLGEAGAVARLPRFSRLLHWLTALFVLVLVGTGVVMKQLGYGPVADRLYTFHKTAGAALLAIVVVRLAARLVHRFAAGGHPIHPVHLALYALLLALPLLGWAGVSEFGARGLLFGLELPRIWPEGTGHAGQLFTAHAWLAFVLLGLVTVHIGIALGDYVQRHARRAGRLGVASARREASIAGRDMP